MYISIKEYITYISIHNIFSHQITLLMPKTKHFHTVLNVYKVILYITKTTQTNYRKANLIKVCSPFLYTRNENIHNEYNKYWTYNKFIEVCSYVCRQAHLQNKKIYDK